jgi:hypothetical protein
LKQNSKNSSKPPSQDISKGFKAKEKKKGETKRGAQPGHEGHEPPLYPIEQCQSVEEHYSHECIYDELLNQKQLAKRLGVDDSVVEQHKTDGKEFAEWSISKDPERIPWKYTGANLFRRI